MAGEDVSEKELVGVEEIGFPGWPVLRSLSRAGGGGWPGQVLADWALDQGVDVF